RIEVLKVKTAAGAAKLAGVVACLGGAATLAFYKALAVERDLEQWKLGWNVRLLAVLYCGIMVTGVTYYLQTWVIEKRGPVFLAMSTPLALIMTMFSSVILLGEIISLGSLLGSCALVLGLYFVLWGKSREQMPKSSVDLEQASCLNETNK
ncbi:auxin-induced protein 5ng4-like, partial [Trifolium pratense]